MASTAVEQIKERISIVDLVGEYVELKHAGKNFKAKSPFTNEKTPSFYVSPDRGMYYCFSSQQGGDIFTFVEKMEGVDFKGALKILAEKAGVELVPEDPKKRTERETQYALLEEATKYFVENRENHKEIDTYLKDRGVEEKTIHTWRIGYALDEWRALRNHMKEKGFSDTDLFRAGLIKEAGAGKEPYDLFRGRIMFPIMDASGRVVAFSGRTLKTEKEIPKYVNSPETELFQKSEILYGYDKAKSGIRQLGFSLIVEGQFDLVMSHQAGYTNAVAVSGTALTPFHISLLTRLSPKVVLALDADRAGVSAIKRSAVPMLHAGMDVKVAHIPDGKDPADVVKEDPKQLKKIVGKSDHVIEFLLSSLKETTKDERTYKLRVREEILPLLVAIENRIDREHFEGIIAEQIDSTKEGVHFEVKRLEEDASHKRREEQKDTRREVAKTSTRYEKLGKYLRALIEVCTGERAWVRERIVAELKNVFSKLEIDSFLGPIEDSETQAICFELEGRVDEISEREFLDEVGHTLTQFAHTKAKAELQKLRSEQRNEETKGNMAESMKLQEKAKPYETLLQKEFTITRESEAEQK